MVKDGPEFWKWSIYKSKANFVFIPISRDVILPYSINLLFNTKFIIQFQPVVPEITAFNETNSSAS